MIPDVGAGMPWTALWFSASIYLLGLTLIAGGCLALLNRALKKRDAADAQRDTRITELDEQIREQMLQNLERDAHYQDEVHKLQVEMLRCQKEQCGQHLPRDEYMGDFMRLQNETRDALIRLEGKMEALITRVHVRVDSLMASPEVEKK